MDSKSMPEFALLRELHSMFDAKYGRNIIACYIVHPTFWLKLFVTFLSPWLSNHFKDHLKYVETLKDLFQLLSREQLKLPLDILK
jgi:hypothetical protein